MDIPTEMATKFNADGINDINVGEPLKPINVEEADALLFQRDTQRNSESIMSKSPPINAPIYDEVIKEFGNSIIMPELFDIQVREIDEALMTNGQNPNGSEIPKTTTNRVVNSPTQHAILAEDERTRKAGITETRKKKHTHTHTQNL